jgi:hypothetical protein
MERFPRKDRFDRDVVRPFLLYRTEYYVVDDVKSRLEGLLMTGATPALLSHLAIYSVNPSVFHHYYSDVFVLSKCFMKTTSKIRFTAIALAFFLFSRLSPSPAFRRRSMFGIMMIVFEECDSYSKIQQPFDLAEFSFYSIAI